MIKDNFLLCPDCRKKIQPIDERDTINGTVYCNKCRAYWKVVIANKEILKIEKRVIH